MTTFEYLAVLFSVVVGLAIVHTLQGLLSVARHWQTTRLYLPALIWTAAIVQWTIFFWWFSGYGLVGLEEWRLTTLLFVLAYGSNLFFLLGLLYPDHIGANFDMRAHFVQIRTWFFGLFLVLGFMEAADISFKLIVGTSALAGRNAVEYLAFMVMWIIGALVALRTRNPRLVGGIGLLFFLASLYITNRYAGVMGPDLNLR